MNARRLVLEDRFTGPELDDRRWVAHYLPQWTTRERSLARYALTARGLKLLITADQPAWREEDGAMRVSNIQTATFSGPVGSQVGTHRHRDDLRVVTAQQERRLFVATAGMAEAELRASDDPTVMLAFWLVGLEQSPDESGEICVAELFGDSVGPAGSRVNVGIKAHHDPHIHDDMMTADLAVDATQWHTYAAEWGDGLGVRFHVDGELVHKSEQDLGYPMQLMVDLFEFPDGSERDPRRYPKWGDVRAVRVYAT